MKGMRMRFVQIFPMQKRALRIWQARTHMLRRLHEDRNQHYDDFSCPRWYDPSTIAHFKEQPKSCSLSCCGNPRRWWSGKFTSEFTPQERRVLQMSVRSIIEREYALEQIKSR